MLKHKAIDCETSVYPIFYLLVKYKLRNGDILGTLGQDVDHNIETVSTVAGAIPAMSSNWCIVSNIR